LGETVAIAGMLLAVLAVAAGAAVQASIGMGLNLFTVGILALINPVFVPGPLLVNTFLLSAAVSYRLRASIDATNLALSVAGSVLGTLAASAILTGVEMTYLPRVLGALILLGVVLTSAGLRLPLTSTNVVVAGVLAGSMGTIAGIQGPPIALLYQGETPARIRAALLPFFAAASIVSLVALAAIGQFGKRELFASALLLPGIAIGYAAAPGLIRIMSPRTVRILVLTITAVSGIALLVKG
jgi:uncharacterized membrane protein YfcA